jgi:threonine/homoserine/homoserine lactone efflux protein
LLIDVIGDLLPSAIAVALSPIPIIAIVLVLGAPRARSAGPAFALGWIGGLLAVSVIVVLVLGAGSDPDSDDPGISWFKVAIGILFLVMAANQWKKRPKDGQEPETPKLMATIDTATPSKAAMLGAALSGANPKNLALTLAAEAVTSRRAARSCRAKELHRTTALAVQRVSRSRRRRSSRRRWRSSRCR